jgi:outer membrane protein assembly factor BamA
MTLNQSLRIVLFFLVTVSFPYSVEAQRIRLWSDTSKNVRRIFLPVVVYSPETHVGVGGLGVVLWKNLHPALHTRTSNAEMLFLYTTRHQLILIPRYTIFTSGEKWMFEGFGEELINFRDNYFGIGDKTPNSNQEEVTYNVLGWENRVGRRLFKDKRLFVGAETRFIHFYHVRTDAGGLLETEKNTGYAGSTSVGLGPSLTWDERDNVVNASKGFYWDFRYSAYSKALGGSVDYHRVIFDFRKYVTVNPIKRHILAFQLYGNFVRGNVPFKELAELGGPRVLRGYYRGRYRDNYLTAFQTEYRMPLYKKLGFVAFAGLAKVYDPSTVNFESLHYSYGGGLRFTINKKERLNLRLDWGRGDTNNSGYFYLGFAESF